MTDMPKLLEPLRRLHETIRASVVDSDGKPVKERTLVVVPGRQPELDPLKTMRVSIMIDGFSDSDNRANIKMEVTGFILR